MVSRGRLAERGGRRARFVASDDRLFVGTARGRVYALGSCAVDVGGRRLY